NGTQPESVAGLQATLRPLAWRMPCAKVTQAPAPAPVKAFAIAGFSPEGRKKFVRAAATHGAPEMALTPQGKGPEPTKRGPPVAREFGSASAACQFFTSRSPRTVLALMGRFR